MLLSMITCIFFLYAKTSDGKNRIERAKGGDRYASMSFKNAIKGKNNCFMLSCVLTVLQIQIPIRKKLLFTAPSTGDSPVIWCSWCHELFMSRHEQFMNSSAMFYNGVHELFSLNVHKQFQEQFMIFLWKNHNHEMFLKRTRNISWTLDELFMNIAHFK